MKFIRIALPIRRGMNSEENRILFLLLLFSLFVPFVSAQSLPPLSQEQQDSIYRSYDVDDVVVYGTKRLPKIIPAQELAGIELKRLSVASVADAIRYFSGVQIKDHGGLRGLKTVNIRSKGTQHIGAYKNDIQ